MIRTSPKVMAILYFAMGILFTFFAIKSTHGTIWNLSTIALAAIATLDFGVSYRMLRMHLRIRNNKKE